MSNHYPTDLFVVTCCVFESTVIPIWHFDNDALPLFLCCAEGYDILRLVLSRNRRRMMETIIGLWEVDAFEAELLKLTAIISSGG